MIQRDLQTYRIQVVSSDDDGKYHYLWYTNESNQLMEFTRKDDAETVARLLRNQKLDTFDQFVNVIVVPPGEIGYQTEN